MNLLVLNLALLMGMAIQGLGEVIMVLAIILMVVVVVILMVLV